MPSRIFLIMLSLGSLRFFQLVTLSRSYVFTYTSQEVRHNHYCQKTLLNFIEPGIVVQPVILALKKAEAGGPWGTTETTLFEKRSNYLHLGKLGPISMY